MANKQRVADPKTHYHTFRLNDRQEVEFENLRMKSGLRSKSKFILSRIFD